MLLAPSGLPLRAVAHGSLVFTAKVSGVPELLLCRRRHAGPRGKMQLPVFHPCVRASLRWRERAGRAELRAAGRAFLAHGVRDGLACGWQFRAASAKRKAGRGSALPASVSVSVSAPAFSVHLNLHPLPLLLLSAQPSGFSSSLPSPPPPPQPSPPRHLHHRQVRAPPPARARRRRSPTCSARARPRRRALAGRPAPGRAGHGALGAGRRGGSEGAWARGTSRRCWARREAASRARRQCCGARSPARRRGAPRAQLGEGGVAREVGVRR